MNKRATELITLLKAQIKNDKPTNGDGDSASWDLETGILLTPNEAKQCLAALEGREQACEAVISQAKEVARLNAYAHAPKNFLGLTRSFGESIPDYVNRTWQQYLTTPSRAFLVAEGKINDQ